MLKDKIICVFLIICLAACSDVFLTPTQVSRNYTSVPVQESATTSMSVVPIVTPSFRASTLSPKESLLGVICVEINQLVASTPDKLGSMLLLQEEDSGEVYLWNIKTAEKHLIKKAQDEILSDFAVSPNGELWVLIRSTFDGIVTTSSKLELRSSNGELQRVMPIGIGLFITRFFDNEHLLLSHGLAPNSKQYILNPFTGLQEELNLTFSDLYNLPRANNQWGNALIYDPSLTRVVYAGMPADIVLVDVASKGTISRISPVPVVHAIPKWSPDGQQIVIAYANILKPMNDPDNWTFELYSLSRTGRFDRLTNLSSYYDHPRMPFYYWSPNGRYIAFWLESNPRKSPGVYEFSVLDLNTEEVTNYCIKNVPQGQIPALFWSPDSQWVALDVYHQNDKKTKDILILDIRNRSATKVAENLSLLGWMVEP